MASTALQAKTSEDIDPKHYEEADCTEKVSKFKPDMTSPVSVPVSGF